MKPGIHFLGWNRPWAGLVTDWLRASPELLRRRWLVLPTHESGRRVRELLAEGALQNGSGAVLGPRLATPDEFFRSETPMPDALRWAGWVQALREGADAAAANLFPSGISEKTDGWRLGVARQIEQARELLAAGNFGFRDVADRLAAERERWLELAALEERAVAQWRRWGAGDPVAAKRERALNPARPLGVDELIVACVPDPTWLAVEAWKTLARSGLKVTVLVGAPDKYRAAFDDWGRPLSSFWTDRSQFATPEPAVAQVAADPTGLAQGVLRACDGKPNRQMAIGICAPGFAPGIGRRLREAGWETYDPQGNALARDSWPELLEALAAALESPEDHAAIARVARHPVIWREFLKDSGARFVFQLFDKWERDKSATSSSRAIEMLGAEKSEPLQAAGRLLGETKRLLTAKRGALETKLAEWLQADEAVAERARVEMEAWERLGKASLPGLLRWLGVSLSGICRVAPFEPNALPLQGWLELAFDPAPHLVLAGLHEGAVPEAPAANPLITDVLREQLGLRDRRSRLARDIFLYTAMVEGRRDCGSVTVITAQVDAQGEPCKPSRVLLQCEAPVLPGRVLRWIKSQADLPAQPTPPWSRGAWQLQPPPGTPSNRNWESISPSALRSYLACPTRFYFEQVLGWKEFEPFDGELDGGGFGSLIHDVLHEWGEDKRARELDDPDKLRGFWLDALNRRAASVHGKELPPLLQLQILSARERLMALADVQARERRAGWQVIEVEKQYKDVLKLAGVPLSLRIDRIDRHLDGRVRVIDYKTARRATDPRGAHLDTWSADSPEPLGPFVEGTRGGHYGWIDLQLPLYARTVELALGLEQAPSAFYALLPEAVTDTEFVEFEKMPEMLDCAMKWAEEAVRRIKQGVFWPPVAEPAFDTFAALAPDGLINALGPAWAELLGGAAAKEGAVMS